MLADLDGDPVQDLLLRSSDQATGPDQVLALAGRTGKPLARWLAGHSQLAPHVLTVAGVRGVLIDRAEPEDRERSALELVRLRLPGARR